MKSKIFRLFVSSTFNDFQREREVLQSRVFPEIKAYCKKLGYIFQPIDLRWGINHEAQLDQKTLELCLNEVKSCKTYPQPNFIILLGDRYGWIPLPYAIEKDEFEILLEVMSPVQRKSTLEWYQKDYNQIPPSYLLKARQANFEDPVKWNEIEALLRTTFQEATRKSSLTPVQKQKYFLSATEAEAIEGISSFSKNDQENTLQHKSIFGFLRDIDPKSRCQGLFISHDYKQAQIFKAKIKEVLHSKSILQVKTKQVDRDLLDESYLEIFIEQTIAFLRSKFEEQRKKQDAQKFTDLDIELQQQALFSAQKSKNFLGRTATRAAIQEYINNKDTNPLILYGPSGIGKSALMAQAIKETQVSNSNKVLYRFVGATPNSNHSRKILLGLFQEIDSNINRSLNIPRTPISNHIQLQKQMDFEVFSKRAYEKLLSIEEAVIIFIDGVDQLTNNDQFSWLPKKLPAGVKIILSALKDNNYPDEEKYFEALKQKSNNLIEITAYKKPLPLLHHILKESNRTIQRHQENYFLEQFNFSPSPLYITIAAETMKHWRSYDSIPGQKQIKPIGRERQIANSQPEIIREFIDNLNKFNHHQLRFLQKVLSFIAAPKDGISESEILELISTDSGFIKTITSQKWHRNLSKEMPIIFWARLYSALKPFLGIKQQDNQALLYFSHREFSTIINNSSFLEFEQGQLILATEKLISKYQNKEFSENRFGKLYAELTTNNKSPKYIDHSTFINSLSTNWRSKYLTYINNKGVEFNDMRQAKSALPFLNQMLEIARDNANKKDSKLQFDLVGALMNLSISHSILNNNQYSFRMSLEALSVYKIIYEKKPEKWGLRYARLNTNLAYSYREISLAIEALKYDQIARKIIEPIYQENKDKLLKEYVYTLNSLAQSFKQTNQIKEAIKLWDIIHKIIHPQYISHGALFALDYTTNLINLSTAYKDLQKFSSAIKLIQEAIQIRKDLFKKNKSYWASHYINAQNHLYHFYIINGENIKALRLKEKNYTHINAILQGKDQNDDYWVRQQLLTLFDLAHLQKEELAISYINLALEILFFKYKDDNNKWDYIYFMALGKFLEAINFDSDKSEHFFQSSISRIENLHQQAPKKWSNNLCIVLTKYAEYQLIHKKSIQGAIDTNLKVIAILELFPELGLIPRIQNLIRAYQNISYAYEKKGELKIALDYITKAVEYIAPYYKENRILLLNDYLINSNRLARILDLNKLHQKAIDIQIQVIEEIEHSENQNLKIKIYTRALRQIALFYSNLSQAPKALPFLEKAEKYIKSHYEFNKKYWALRLRNTLISLAKCYQLNQQRTKAYTTLITLTSLSHVYALKDEKKWGLRYANDLEKLALLKKELGHKFKTDYDRAQRIKRSYYNKYE